MAPDGEGTHVSLTTDLTITGRVAQFGRGALADVSAKLLGQFATCIETEILAGGGTGTDTDTDTDAPDPVPAAPSVRGIAAVEPEPVDLLGAAGAPIARRLVPLAALGLVVLILLRRLRRGTGQGASRRSML